MNRRDTGALVFLVGVAALWATVSGSVLEYLRPGMRVWVGMSALALIVTGVAQLLAARGKGTDQEQHRSTRLGWLVAIPVCVAITVGSGSLGVYAVERNATFRNLPDGPTSFNLEQYMRAASFGGQPVELTLVDVVAAASEEESAAVLDGRSVELIGFVAVADDGSVRLTRFVISCCAADAAVVQVLLESDRPLPEEGTWVRATGTMVLGPPPPGEEQPLPELDVELVDVIPEPDRPYEVPVSRIR